MGTLTVVNSNGAELSNVAVASSACSDVLSAVNAVKASFALTTAFAPVACSNWPVRPDSLIVFQNGTSYTNFKALRIVQIDAPVPDSIDYASLGAIWTFGFAGVVTLWWASKNIGLIVNSIRRF